MSNLEHYGKPGNPYENPTSRTNHYPGNAKALQSFCRGFSFAGRVPVTQMVDPWLMLYLCISFA